MDPHQSNLIPLAPFDAFAEAESHDTTQSSEAPIHLRVQQRNGRKCITTVQGLSADLDLKRLLKKFKKTFNCNGSLQPDPDTEGTVIQMSGDQRQGVRDFLTTEGIVTSAKIISHGA
jgi:translation initiation factor 1